MKLIDLGVAEKIETQNVLKAADRLGKTRPIRVIKAKRLTHVQGIAAGFALAVMPHERHTPVAIEFGMFAPDGTDMMKADGTGALDGMMESGATAVAFAMNTNAMEFKQAGEYRVRFAMDGGAPRYVYFTVEVEPTP
jgi:hypothetical protein